MTQELVSVDTSLAMEAALGTGRGVARGELDALVTRGREVHDDLLLARARGQIGFADLYMLGREAVRARDASETLAARFENVAVLGLGAEADVARSILDSLAHPFHNLLPKAGRAGRPRVFVLDSTDPDWLGAFLESFAVEQTLFVTLAKSGRELGPLVQHGIVRDMLRKRVGPGFQDHLVVVTDPMAGPLREEAIRDGLLAFDVPSNVPARFGALTPVALLPAALAGVDVRGVLAGAHATAERTAGEDLRSNPAYLLASVLHLLARNHGRRTQLFVAGVKVLGSTALQLARLMEETIVAPARADVAPTPAVTSSASFTLPGDARSLARRCEADGGDAVAVMLDIDVGVRDRVFPPGAPGLEWLAGRSLSDLATAEQVATRDALAARGIPVVSMRLPSLSPSSVGALHMTCMLAAVFGAGLSGAGPGSTGSVQTWGRAVRERVEQSSRPDQAAAADTPAAR